jgi:hypothetical protein
MNLYSIYVPIVYLYSIYVIVYDNYYDIDINDTLLLYRY